MVVSPPPQSTAAGSPRATGILSYSGFVLIGLLALGACFPAIFLRDLTGFSVLAIALCGFLLLPFRRPPFRPVAGFLWINVAFLVLGAVIICTSLLGLHEVDTLLPLRKSYIPRHAFFIIVWAPFIVASYIFWFWSIERLTRFFGRHGLWLLAVMAAADLLTSHLLGDPRFRVWSGYTYYFEKLTFVFLFVLVYLTCIMFSRAAALAACLILLHGAASRWLGLGIVFNAQTGFLILVILLLASVPLLSLRARSLGVMSLVAVLYAALVYGMFFPKQFSGDSNTYWRLEAWRQNFVALQATGFTGVGFGTPYHPVTPETIRNTMLNDEDMRQGGARDFVEPQYYRGQHSSVINVFYRMGIIGGVLFVLINAGALLLAYRGIGAAADPIQRRHCFIALVLLVTQIVQMSIHVGLETPRFILLYVLSIGLAVFAFLQTQFSTAFRVAVPSTSRGEPLGAAPARRPARSIGA